MAGSRAQHQDTKSLNVLRCLKSLSSSSFVFSRCFTFQWASSWEAGVRLVLCASQVHEASKLTDLFPQLCFIPFIPWKEWIGSLARRGICLLHLVDEEVTMCLLFLRAPPWFALRCWIGGLESLANFGFFVWKSEVSRLVLNNVLPARNWAYLRDVWAISKESYLDLQRDAYHFGIIGFHCSCLLHAHSNLKFKLCFN